MRQGSWVVSGFWAVLAVGAVSAALATLRQCRPTVLVDPFLGYSAVGLPTWHRPPLDFTAGTALVAVDQTPVTRATLEHVFDQRCAAGERQVALTFGASTVHADFGKWTVQDVWWFFGLFACFSGLFAWSAWFLASVRGELRSHRAYQLVALLSSAFLLTYFDYHSTRWLTGVFAGATAGLPFALLLLAASFAAPPDRSQTRIAAASSATAAFSVLVAVAVGLGADLPLLRGGVNVLLPASLFALALTMSWRFRSGTEHQRAAIRTAAVGLVVMPIIAGAGAIIGQVRDSASLSIAVPLLGLTVPASVGWAMLRADVFDVGRSVSRASLIVPLVLLALIVAASTTVAADVSGIAAGLLLASTFGLALMGLQLLVTRVIFRASARFKPIVEALTRDVAAAREPAVVEAAIRRAMRAFLPEAEVTFSPAPNEALRLSMRAGDETHGLVSLIRPPVSPLLTEDDVELARVLATIGGLAVHNARVVEALDAARSLERRSADLSRSLAVDVVAAELAHELTYPLVYFRHFFERPVLDAERLELGREEVARLERLVGEARRAQREPLRLSEVDLAGLLARVVALLEPQLAERRQRCLVDVPPGLVLAADSDLSLQLLANLLRNASDAAPPEGNVGVSASTDDGGTLISVWDEGPGLAPGVELFVPFRSTRTNGVGLGLIVSQRIARAHGWRIEAHRRGGRTCFDVHVPRPETRP